MILISYMHNKLMLKKKELEYYSHMILLCNYLLLYLTNIIFSLLIIFIYHLVSNNLLF